MNVRESCIISSPSNKEEECAKFIIDDLTNLFALSGIMVASRDYTFSCWIRSDTTGSVSVCGETCNTTTDWQHFSVSFTAADTDLPIIFGATGTYYIYHAQLEIGNMATDWTVAVEDVDEGIIGAKNDAQNAQSTADDATKRAADAEASLNILEDSIQMLVTDENGSSLMVQEGNRWTFSMAPYANALSSVSNALQTLADDLGGIDSAVERLNNDVGDMKDVHPYMRVGSANNQPYLELGVAESEFKLRITNTEILFIDGAFVPAYLSNQKLYIEKAEVTDELQFGGFVWKKRDNGNMGVVWLGGSS